MAAEPVVLRCALAATAAGNDLTVEAGLAPYAATLVSAAYIPAADIVGNTAASRTITVQNQAAADADAPVSMATLAYITNTNGDQAVSQALTLTATAANLKTAANDVIEVTSTHVGAGLADPGGLVILTFVPTEAQAEQAFDHTGGTTTAAAVTG